MVLLNQYQALLETQDGEEGGADKGRGGGLQVSVSTPAGKVRLGPRARQRRIQIATTISFMRSAMRAIFETL